MSTTPSTRAVPVDAVREVTDREVADFWENGWVLLPQLLDPGMVGDLHARAQRLMGADGDGSEPRIGYDYQTTPASRSFRGPSEVDPGFRDLAHSRQLGRNAALLLERDVAHRFFEDILLVKMPADREPDAAQPLGWHQDKNPTDRPWVYFWIPLDHVAPEQGGVRYFSGSHRLGPVWKGGLCVSEDEAFGLAPRLRTFPLSPPLRVAPGDVVAHRSWVVHGTDANTGDRTRWVYRPAYFPADALYLGGPSPMIAGRGVGAYEQLDHADFPVVYQPGAVR